MCSNDGQQVVALEEIASCGVTEEVGTPSDVIVYEPAASHLNMI